MYYPGELKVIVGEILPYGQIKVEVLEVKGHFYWKVNGKPK